MNSKTKKLKSESSKGKYWYYTTVYTCVLCGYEKVYRERRYDPKPEDPVERWEFHDTACWGHF